VADRISAVETGLRRPFEPAGKAQGLSLSERLAFHRVPGVSIALIEDGQVAWSRGYGLRSAGASEPVTPRTLFQAASISKAVAALVALTLVNAGTIELDTPITETLTSVSAPNSFLIKSRPITLRRLLAHRAQITIHGFVGYEKDAALPTTAQTLEGEAPANTPAIDRSSLLSAEFQYSGGGYMLMQQWLEDVTERGFAALAQEQVLGPLEMADSTFLQPLPKALHGRVSQPHNEHMVAVEGGWVALPELAAAGLWTTSADLARFGVGILRSLSGAPRAIISKELALDMVRSQRDSPPKAGEKSWGLGLELLDEGSARIARHDGANPPGYLCTMLFFPETGQGAAVMVSSNRGYFLIREVLRALAWVYDWPGERYRPVAVATVPLEAETLDRLSGFYLRGDERWEIRRVADHLRLLAPGPIEADLYPVSEREFFVADKPSETRFHFSEEAGPAATLRVLVDGVERVHLSRIQESPSPENVH
jgi:CubicO group peptidase (beta-lactamase class C family)